MLQFFSICLSNSEPSYPISVYGIFAVRDELDKRRNYLFNCPRDDAVMVEMQVIKVCFASTFRWLVNNNVQHCDFYVN